MLRTGPTNKEIDWAATLNLKTAAFPENFNQAHRTQAKEDGHKQLSAARIEVQKYWELTWTLPKSTFS